MIHLPQPGPGRPHHRSYSDPEPMIDPGAVFLILACFGFLYGLLEVVV